MTFRIHFCPEAGSDILHGVPEFEKQGSIYESHSVFYICFKCSLEMILAFETNSTTATTH